MVALHRLLRDCSYCYCCARLYRSRCCGGRSRLLLLGILCGCSSMGLDCDTLGLRAAAICADATRERPAGQHVGDVRHQQTVGQLDLHVAEVIRDTDERPFQGQNVGARAHAGIGAGRIRHGVGDVRTTGAIQAKQPYCTSTRASGGDDRPRDVRVTAVDLLGRVIGTKSRGTRGHLARTR